MIILLGRREERFLSYRGNVMRTLLIFVLGAVTANGAIAEASDTDIVEDLDIQIVRRDRDDLFMQQLRLRVLKGIVEISGEHFSLLCRTWSSKTIPEKVAVEQTTEFLKTMRKWSVLPEWLAEEIMPVLEAKANGDQYPAMPMGVQKRLIFAAKDAHNRSQTMVALLNESAAIVRERTPGFDGIILNHNALIAGFDATIKKRKELGK